MPTLSRQIKKMLTMDDGPTVLSKFMTILDEEADRILEVQVGQRTAQDINTVIKAATFLTTMTKVDSQMEKQVRHEVVGTYKQMAQADVQALIDKIKS